MWCCGNFCGRLQWPLLMCTSTCTCSYMYMYMYMYMRTVGSTREIGGERCGFVPLCRAYLVPMQCSLPPSGPPSLPLSLLIIPLLIPPCLSLPVPLCLLAGPLYNMKFMAGLWYAHTRWYKLLLCKMNMAVSQWWLEC